MVAEPDGRTEAALFDVDPAQVEIRRKPVKLPARLSPSRAGDFVQCPLMFRFRSVDKLPEPPSPAATLGTLVHAVLERLFDKPAGARTPEAAHELVAPEWEKLLAERPQLAELFDSPRAAADWLATAGPLLDRYFTLEDPNRYEPARREWRVDTVIGEGEDRLRVGGIIDRVDIAPNGMVQVVDYKTGKAPSPGYEAKVMFQMKFYALVLWRLRGAVPKRLQLIFMGSGDVLAHDPDERDLLATEQKVAAIWLAIRQAASSREWPAKPSRLCDWCAFKPICPAHGGEPPAAPEVIVTPVSD
jgi:putative RecB family exonuclease